MRIHDGAYGTLLLPHCNGDETVDDLCVRAPALVADAHRAYLDAGATVVQTNSFLAHLRTSDRRRRAIIEASLACAREAAELAPDPAAVTVLATIGPAGEQPRDFWRSIEQVLEAGVAGVLCETVHTRAIADAFLAAWADVAAGVADVELLLGCTINPSRGVEACRWVRELAGDADAAVHLGLNCCEGPAGLQTWVEELCEQRGGAWLMPSAGIGAAALEPAAWADAVGALLAMDLPISGIGGCCGTTPAHLNALGA